MPPSWRPALKIAETPRSLALEVLDKIAKTSGYSDIVLDACLKNASTLDQRDKSLAGNLAYGVLRWQNLLDAHIEQVSNLPLRKIKPRLLWILRMGAYQLFFLNRIPHRAAVNETVNLARNSGFFHAAGFVNAVMRKLSSVDHRLSLPKHPAARFSLLFGCPVWIVELWLKEHGVEGTEAMLGQLSRIPSRWLRIDSRKINMDRAVAELEASGIEAYPGAFAPEAILIKYSGDLRDIPMIVKGQALVQDQASQLIAHMLAPKPGWKILDACAAPGLKATHLAQLAGDETKVVALEIHGHRARAMAETCEKHGFKNVEIIVGDALDYKAEFLFDAILADAPCSGLGVLNRNPEAKWRLDPEKMKSLPKLQCNILLNLADSLKVGGVLIYSTCTSSRAENDGVIECFLAQRSDFRLERPPMGEFDFGDLVSSDGFLKTYPRAMEDDESRALDGFFGARLKKVGS